MKGAQLKNATPEMRNSLEGLSSRIEMTEEKTVKLKLNQQK